MTGGLRLPTWWSNPASLPLRIAACGLVLGIPALLFADSLLTYRLHSDDFEYLAHARTWQATQASLFEAHNTHIVPAWRILTWLVMVAAGSLARLQGVLAVVSYLALVLTMLAVGRLVGRETHRGSMGLLGMILMGTTSVLWSSGTWYSSGQTLWAALGVLGTLLALQSWKCGGGWWKLGAAAFLAYVAGGFWTIGHAAGPVGAIYLLADSRKRVRWGAVVPLAATGAAIAVALALGGRGINARISFHGRSQAEAANPAVGLTHTLQAIPEDLVAQNLGLETVTTEGQGAILCGLIGAIWLASWLRPGGRRPYPLEFAGTGLVWMAYLVEWTFRGYLPFSSLRGVVPWYDTIPHVGAVLTAACWVDRLADRRSGPDREHHARPTIGALIVLLAVQACCFLANRQRVESLFIQAVPAECFASVEPMLVTHELKLSAARDVAAELVRRQRFDLDRLDRASSRARALGIGRDAVASAFGRIAVLELPPVYDAIGLLGLPHTGSDIPADRVRSELDPFFRPSALPVLSLETDALGRTAFQFGPKFQPPGRVSGPAPAPN